MFGCKASDIPIRIARNGVDKSLKTENLSLEFDSGKLKRIQFEGEYEFKNPPEPYPESWKNFPALGATRIFGQMPRRDFLSYLKAWDQRARTLGGRRIQAGGDLRDQEYSIGVVRDDFVDMIVVNMGPSRRAGGGGLWCDGWCLFFSLESDHQKSGIEVGRIQSLSAFRDEFNTVARRIVM
jgi:hypothetical protein